METAQKTVVTIQADINAPVSKVWEYWTKPGHITQWAFASPEWHAPKAENDLRVGGSFSSRMEAKDGSMGFDFGGVYDAVEQNKYIEYTLGDGRNVKINFTADGDTTKVVQHFEAESQNSIEMQQFGWQAILNNFKEYAESN